MLVVCPQSTETPWAFPISNGMEKTQDDLEKKSYEVSFLLESEDKVSDVRRLISQHGVDVAEELLEKKINLAYPIKNVTHALFGAWRVLAEPVKIKLLEKDLMSSKNVLRSLIISMPKEKDVHREVVQRSPILTRRTSVLRREPKPRPLSNEAIEKKIEEILQ